MTTAVVGLLLPVGAVWLLMLALRLRKAGDSTLLTLALALCCGLGLSSVVTFWWTVLGAPLGSRFVGVDVLLWVSIALVSWRVLQRTRVADPVSSAPAPGAPRLTIADWLVRAAFVAVAFIAVATVVAHYRAGPHGEWDAWAIWNQKARFLLRETDHWTQLLAIAWTNPSHPLLVSLSVARLWAYAGSETTLVPAMLGLLWGVGIVAAVMGALDTRLRRAWIAGCAVVAPGAFPQLAAAQTADLAIALFLVVTLVMLRAVVQASTSDAQGTRAGMLLAGLAAGTAAWTKNEGLLLVGVSTLIVASMMLSHRRPLAVGWWLGGVLPFGLTVAWLKLVEAPIAPEYMSEMQGPAGLMERALDPAHHALIARLTGWRWVTWGGPWAAGALLLTIVAAAGAVWSRAGESARVVLLVVVAMFAGYYAMWVVSPLDTPWLVNTTFDRLLMQLWPSLVLVAFSAVPVSGDARLSPEAPVALSVGPNG